MVTLPGLLNLQGHEGANKVQRESVPATLPNIELNVMKLILKMKIN